MIERSDIVSNQRKLCFVNEVKSLCSITEVSISGTVYFMTDNKALLAVTISSASKVDISSVTAEINYLFMSGKSMSIICRVFNSITLLTMSNIKVSVKDSVYNKSSNYIGMICGNLTSSTSSFVNVTVF